MSAIAITEQAEQLLPWVAHAGEIEEASVLVWARTELEARHLGAGYLSGDFEETEVHRAALSDEEIARWCPPSRRVEHRAEVMRAADMHDGNDLRCDDCGLASFGDRWPVCPECGLCSECGCAEVCTPRVGGAA